MNISLLILETSTGVIIKIYMGIWIAYKEKETGHMFCVWTELSDSNLKDGDLNKWKKFYAGFFVWKDLPSRSIVPAWASTAAVKKQKESCAQK